jgi:tetratricopeptide (TPR) repeat protein
MLSTAASEPFYPASDKDVIERLPYASSQLAARSERVLRSAWNQDPRNADVSLRLADLYLRQSRREADPRYLGRAQAILIHWWEQDTPPAEILMLRATIKQSGHYFDAALKDLQKLVKLQPQNAQAWLTFSTVKLVTGDIQGARAACEELGRVAALYVAVTCQAAVDSVNGRAAFALEQLDTLNEQATNQEASLRVWSMTIQAETANRLGRPAVADEVFRKAMLLEPTDPYLLATYSDMLLDIGVESRVLKLIPDSTRSDSLLIRRAIAAKRLKLPEFKAIKAVLQSRFAAGKARGERLHLREEALMVLHVGERPGEALDLALENWKLQKEPIDARLVIEAALASGKPDKASAVVAWVRKNKLEDFLTWKFIGQLATPITRNQA